MQHNVYVCFRVCTVIFVFINTKLCSSFSESCGSEGEILYLSHRRKIKWPRVFIPVFRSFIQVSCVGLLERDGKGSDNNIELRLEITLCILQLGEESSSDFISVSVPHLAYW